MILALPSELINIITEYCNPGDLLFFKFTCKKIRDETPEVVGMKFRHLVSSYDVMKWVDDNLFNWKINFIKSLASSFKSDYKFDLPVLQSLFSFVLPHLVC